MNRRIQLSAFALAFAIRLPLAHAEENEAAKQEAQKLYQDAAKDIDHHEYARACPKLEAARRIMPEHVRTAMTLAECYDKWGKPKTALAVLETAKSLAVQQGITVKVSEIESKLADLTPRVPRLTISVPRNVATLPGLSIVYRGSPLSGTLWGTTFPVNPGTHTIEVKALGKPPWQTSVEMQVGQSVTIEITPPWSVGAEKPKKINADDNSSQAGSSPVPPTIQQRSGRRIAGFVGISLGVAAGGAGAVLGGLAVSKNNASDDGHCKLNNHCDRIGFDLRTDARTVANASTALFIAGGLVMASGAILVATSSSGKGEEARRNAPQTRLWIGPGTITMRGQW